VAQRYNRPWWDLLRVREDWLTAEAELIDIEEELIEQARDKK